MAVIRHCNFMKRKCGQEKAENILKCEGFMKQLQRMYNAKKKLYQ